jgi:hypothetical protein
MRRGLGIDVLDCPKCHQRMQPVSVLTERDVVEKIMSHLKLPLHPEELEDGTVAYDVTSEPVPDAEWWTEDDAFRSRGPPREWDGIDAPAPVE